jgi:aspartokinase-like uncharacterized kinase
MLCLGLTGRRGTKIHPKTRARSMAASHRLTVVKLGGSYAFSPHLPLILQAIEAADSPVVIVPGGGPFADTVRAAQPRMGLSDRAAHRMALLAMAQFAEALAGLSSGIRPAETIASIRITLAQGQIPVWSPWPLADGLGALPESWELTSDSLAAWLAGRLRAARLLLIKHRDAPNGPVSLTEAAQRCIVDPMFPNYAAQAARLGSDGQRPDAGNLLRIVWIGPAQLDRLAEILDGRLPAGLELGATAPESIPA